ncbi:MAG TPA: FAD-dependent oxidoreductase [Ktedonobacterales bacterium]|nr:FAD-dependent oxidoreductase [Ktedonobacterales bacterium]
MAPTKPTTSAPALRSLASVARENSASPWSTAQASAPWRATLEPAVAKALALPRIDDVADGAVDAADIVVIGAGIAGLSAAHAASATGARTVVLEAASAIGQGATGRNAGILSAGINMGLADLAPDSPEREMWPATTRALLALVEEAAQPGAMLSASLTGALSLAETPAAARRLVREARTRVALGLRAEIWTPAQVAERTGGRLDTRRVVQALWLPDEGRIHPLTLLARTAAQARAAGAILVGDAHVERWQTRPGNARHASQWHVRLATGRELTARGVIVATGPVATPTARIYALAYALDLPDDFPLFWDAAPYTYCDYRPGDGRLITSGGRYGLAGGSAREATYYQRLARGAQRWLPELAQTTPTHAWAVDLDVSADLAPRLRGLDERAPGVAIEGLGALGVLPGSILGRRAGEQLAQRLNS